MTVTVAVAGSRAEAELIVGMLRSNGVAAAVSADDAGGVEVALQAQGVRVIVPDTQVHRARELLDDGATTTKRLNVLQRWIVRLLGGSTDETAR